MADEIDPLTVPAVLPANVPRTTSEGYPTKFLLNWEQQQQSWFVNNTITLQTKITTVSDQTGANTAEVEQITQALTDGTGAYGSYITTINAKANDATASGELYFAAKAAPTGTTAAYGMYLSADDSYAGIEAIAVSGVGSAIGLTANQFYFTDSGTAQQVLTYDGTSFVFNVPVIIRSGTSGARKVSTGENDKIYDASNQLRVAIGINI